jgi:hypothetical protein
MTRDLVLTPIPQRTTSQESAWENGKYETYRLGFAIPAVRLHERGTIRTGSWFAVDEYNLSVPSYRGRYALLDRHKRPQLEVFLLAPGTIVNVGRAGRQAPFAGGGLQFEVLLGGPEPQPIEHVDNPKRVRF